MTFRRRFGTGFLCGVLFLLGLRTLVNETAVADWMVAPLIRADTAGPADVMVVLGGGIIGHCEPNLHSLRRTVLATTLWREGRAPLLLFTGGTPSGMDCPVSTVMAELARAFGVPPSSVLVETASSSTAENAAQSALLLRGLGADRILLVTDRLHMPRASSIFARQGFRIERATVPVYAGSTDNVAMLVSGLREYVALGYYWWRGWLAPPPPGASAEARSSGGRQAVAGRADASRAGWREEQPDVSNRARGLVDSENKTVVILGASYAGGFRADTLAGMTVVNKGITGQQSFELLERFERDVVTLRPSTVIVWGFINDIFRGDRDRMDDVQARALASFEQMIERARSHGIEPILATEVTIRPVDTWSEAIAGWIGWLLRKQGYQDRVNALVQATNQGLRDLAEREHVLLLDYERVLSDTGGRRRAEFAAPDGSHISDAGYAALKSYTEPVLAHHLSRRAGPSSR